MASQDSSVNTNSQAETRTRMQTQSVFLGCVVALLLVLLFGGLVSYFLLRNRDFKVDSSLVVPTLETLPKYTNKLTLDINGESEDGSEVLLFIDNKDSEKIVKTRGNGEFTFEDIELAEEKTYKFKAAVVDISIFSKKRSEFSKTETVIVDRTAPRKQVTLEPFSEKSTKDKVTLKGKVAEKDVLVSIKSTDKNAKEFKATVDKDGNFEIKDIELKKGENKLRIILKDLAGNITIARTITITYDDTAAAGGSTGGSVNGNGASTHRDLPDSAGEAEVAQVALIGGLLALATAIFALGGNVFKNFNEALKSSKE